MITCKDCEWYDKGLDQPKTDKYGVCNYYNVVVGEDDECSQWTKEEEE